MMILLQVLAGLTMMAVFAFALWKTGYLGPNRRPTSLLIPRQSPETAYGQVRPIAGETGLTSLLIPRQSPETEYGQVRPIAGPDAAAYDVAYPIVTHLDAVKELAISQPGVWESMEAELTRFCPESAVGEHLWTCHQDVVEGDTVEVWECGYCRRTETWKNEIA